MNTLIKHSGFRPAVLKLVERHGDFLSGNKRKFSSKKGINGTSNSSLLLQDGLKIEEVPLVIRKTINIPDLIRNHEIEKLPKKVDSEYRGSVNNPISSIIKMHIKNLRSIVEVMRYLDVIPITDISPSVALTVLDKILVLHAVGNENFDPLNTFSKSAVIKTLLDIVFRTPDNHTLLNALSTVSKLTEIENKYSLYLDTIVTECIKRSDNDEFEIYQNCQLVGLLHSSKSHRDRIDSLWSNFACRESEIGIEDINKIFASLLYFKTSKEVLLSMLGRRLRIHYAKLSERQVIHILQILCIKKWQDFRICRTLSGWTNVSARLTETGLRDIITLFRLLNYSDSSIQKAICRFVKANGSKIRDTLLITSLAEFSTEFLWYDPLVLHCVSEYFVKHYRLLTPGCFSVIVKTFGHLNYEPANAFKFFQAVEETFVDRFDDFEPNMMLDMLLSCVYLERYPLNFIRNIFSPSFLDRINLETHNNKVMLMSKLMLLNTALTLECPTYSEPHFNFNEDISLWHKLDQQLLRMNYCINNPLCKLLGSYENFQKTFKLPKVQTSGCFIVDFAFNVGKDGYAIPFHSVAGICDRVAIVILLPEEVIDSEKNLFIGPQTTRLRHIKCLGFKVVVLEYSILDRFSHKENFKELVSYLRKNLEPVVKVF